MARRKTDFLLVLRTLAEYRVDFIVVVGVCAALHGAPIATFDLDLVHPRSPENIERLLVTLQTLDARYRGQAGGEVRPTASHLQSLGHQLLITSAGPLDVQGAIGKGRGYDELFERSVEMEVGAGTRIRVLDLETLIKSKEEAGRDKDKAVVAILRQTLKEKSKT